MHACFLLPKKTLEIYYPCSTFNYYFLFDYFSVPIYIESLLLDLLLTCFEMPVKQLLSEKIQFYWAVTNRSFDLRLQEMCLTSQEDYIKLVKLTRSHLYMILY